MNVHERYEYFMSVFMYKIMNNQTANDLREMFQYASDIHTYNTRGANSGKLHIPRCSVECFKKSLQYAGTQIWNNLNTDMKMSPSVQSFKKAYKH